MIQRKIEGVRKTSLQQGFLGSGHMAAAVVNGSEFAKTDPFILLMDDRLDLSGGEPVGGAHPHAGFETVTLVVEGNKEWKTGSLEIMTAGKGIVHTEEITAKTRVHILQLWLVLPPEKRWMEPGLQTIDLEDVPKLKAEGTEIRVYSGSSQGLLSPVKNQTPFTLVDFRLAGKTQARQVLPGGYNGFIYVLEGNVHVGEQEVRPGERAWLSTPTEESEVNFLSGEAGARFILYAGEPQNARIVSYGPFIGDSMEDIARLYQEYRSGKIPHLNDLHPERKVRYQA